MRYAMLSGTPLRPSIIGLGTGSFGSGISAEESFRMMDEYAAVGGNLIDTAHIYAAWLPEGTGKSEQTIGEWLKKSGLRSQMIIASKGAHFELATPKISRVRPECIDHDIAESLERLQIDSIDLYYLHRDDPAVPVGELLDALQPHLQAGRVKAIGASNWLPGRLQLAAEYARERGVIGFCCSQSGWSLAQINPAKQGDGGLYYIGDDEMKWHRETSFPLFGFGSQAQGFFAQTWSWPDQADFTPKQKALQRDYYSEKNVRRWQRATSLAEKRGCSANAIALAYITSQSFPSFALIGPNRTAQLSESLAATDLQLTPDEIAFLEG